MDRYFRDREQVYQDYDFMMIIDEISLQIHQLLDKKARTYYFPTKFLHSAIKHIVQRGSSAFHLFRSIVNPQNKWC